MSKLEAKFILLVNPNARFTCAAMLKHELILHDTFMCACIVLIALSRCNRVFTRRLRLCHSHTVYRREVRKGDREGPNRVESEV